MGNSELTPAVKAETKRDGAARDRHSAYPAAALSNPLPLTHPLGQNSQNILAIQRTFGNRYTTRLLATNTPLRGSGSGEAIRYLQRDTVHGPASNPPQPAAAPPPVHGPVYDTAVDKNEPHIDPAQTAASVRAEIARVSHGKITNAAIKPNSIIGTPAEIFLLNKIFGLGKEHGWEPMQADIIMTIGRPSRPGTAPPRGKVTVRIDSGGQASAELLPDVAPNAAPPVADLKAELRRQFNLADILGPWTDADLRNVLAALTLWHQRAPQDLEALSGVELIRVPELNPSLALPGERIASGLFKPGDPVARQKPSLTLADSAFAGDPFQFFGGGRDADGKPVQIVPSSFEAIVHEVGHAVEKGKFRLAQEEYVKKGRESQAADIAQLESDAAFKSRRKEIYDGKHRTKPKERKDLEDLKGLEHQKNANQAAAANAQNEFIEDRGKMEAEEVGDAGFNMTRRLNSFIALVNGPPKIAPFTTYAIRHPDNPEEFYADAYALCIVEPGFMQTNYPAIFNFFRQGGGYS